MKKTLTSKDKQKMQTFYDTKYDEYIKLPIEDLKTRSEKKLSSTERKALFDAALFVKMKAYEKYKLMKESLEDDGN